MIIIMNSYQKHIFTNNVNKGSYNWLSKYKVLIMSMKLPALHTCRMATVPNRETWN